MVPDKDYIEHLLWLMDQNANMATQQIVMKTSQESKAFFRGQYMAFLTVCSILKNDLERIENEKTT